MIDKFSNFDYNTHKEAWGCGMKQKTTLKQKAQNALPFAVSLLPGGATLAVYLAAYQQYLQYQTAMLGVTETLKAYELLKDAGDVAFDYLRAKAINNPLEIERTETAMNNLVNNPLGMFPGVTDKYAGMNECEFMQSQFDAVNTIAWQNTAAVLGYENVEALNQAMQSSASVAGQARRTYQDNLYAAVDNAQNLMYQSQPMLDVSNQNAAFTNDVINASQGTAYCFALGSAFCIATMIISSFIIRKHKKLVKELEKEAGIAQPPDKKLERKKKLRGSKPQMQEIPLERE